MDMQCELCHKVLNPALMPVYTVRCKECGQMGYLCGKCKRKHPKLHNHPVPLRLVPRGSLLQEEHEQITSRPPAV
jgi:hypothetical protein